MLNLSDKKEIRADRADVVDWLCKSINLFEF